MADTTTANRDPVTGGVMGVPPGTAPASGSAFNQDTIDFIGKLLATKQSQRAKAIQDIGSMFQMHKAGFPVNFDAFGKLANRAGLKDVLATTPQQLEHSIAANQAGQVQSGAVGTGAYQTPFQQSIPQGENAFGQGPTLPQNPFRQNPDGTINLQPGAPDHVREAVNLHNDAVTGKLDPTSVGPRTRSMYVKAIGHSALQALKAVGEPFKVWGQTQMAAEKAQLEEARNTQMVEHMMNGILANPDSPQSQKDLGTLMQIGKIPFDTNYEEWKLLSPEMRQQKANISAGNESPAELHGREFELANTVLANKILTDPGEAMAYAKARIEGTPISADLQTKIDEHNTFENAMKMFGMGQMLYEMGDDPKKIASHLEAIRHGANPLSLFPKGMHPVISPEMQLRLKQMDLELAKWGVQMKLDSRRLDLLDKEIEQKQATAKSTEEKDRLANQRQALVELKMSMADYSKATNDVDRENAKTMMQDAYQTLINTGANFTMSMEPQGHLWWRRDQPVLKRATPGTTPEGDAKIDQLSGASQTPQSLTIGRDVVAPGEDKPAWTGQRGDDPGLRAIGAVKQGVGAVKKALTPPTTGAASQDPGVRALQAIGGAIGRLRGGSETTTATAPTQSRDISTPQSRTWRRGEAPSPTVAPGLAKPSPATPQAAATGIDEDRIFRSIAQSEAMRGKPYPDRGGMAIGYGQQITSRADLERWQRSGMSQPEAEARARTTIRSTARQIEREHPWTKNLDPLRKEALISMAYNLGIPGFNRFKTFLRLMQQGAYSAAADDLLTNTQYGSDTDQPHGRVLKIANQIRSGEFQER